MFNAIVFTIIGVGISALCKIDDNEKIMEAEKAFEKAEEATQKGA